MGLGNCEVSSDLQDHVYGIEWSECMEHCTDNIKCLGFDWDDFSCRMRLVEITGSLNNIDFAQCWRKKENGKRRFANVKVLRKKKFFHVQCRLLICFLNHEPFVKEVGTVLRTETEIFS